MATDYGLTLVTPPAVDPLTLDEAKDHLRVTYTDDDDYIQSLIAAAAEQFQRATHRQLVTATYDLTLEKFPDGGKPIRIPRAPLQSVTSITYIDTAGASQSLVESTDYDVAVSRLPGEVHLAYGKTWPSTRKQVEAVTVRFVAGVDVGSVDDLAKSALRLMLAQWYEFREDAWGGEFVRPTPNGAKRIMQLYDLGDELLEYGSVGT